MDVALQRHGVAVIQVQAERLGVELVDETLTGQHLLIGQRAVHRRRMPAVEMNRVRMRTLIDECDLDAIAFGGADRRTRHLPVIGPGREEHAGSDLDLAIDRVELVLAQQRAIRPRRLAIKLVALRPG